jgi:hypothetical protein
VETRDGVAATQAIAGGSLLTVKGMVEVPLVACPRFPGALLVVKIRSPSGLVLESALPVSPDTAPTVLLSSTGG